MGKQLGVETSLRVGIALEGTGWHPAAWEKSAVSRAADVFSGDLLVDMARRLEGGGVNFVSVEDGISLQSEKFAVPDQRGDQVRGRLDSIVSAALLLSATTRLEVVVSRNVTHAEPFHVAAQLASLSAIAPGRVVWRPQVSASAADAVVVGGEPTPALNPDDPYEPIRIGRALRELFQNAELFVSVVRHLWATYPGNSLTTEESAGSGRRQFVDAARIRPARHSSTGYGAVGPVNVPVFAMPAVAVLAHHAIEPYQLAAAVADRVFVTPTAHTPVTQVVETLRHIEDLTPDAARTEVYADIAVILGDTDTEAQRRRDDLDAVAGYQWTTDTSIFTGTAHQLVEQIRAWAEDGIRGIRLRPAVIPDDIDVIINHVIPALRAAEREQAG